MPWTEIICKIANISGLNKKGIIELEYIGISHQRAFNKKIKDQFHNYTPDSWANKDGEWIVRQIESSLGSDSALKFIEDLNIMFNEFNETMNKALLSFIATNIFSLNDLIRFYKGPIDPTPRICLKINVADKDGDESKTYISELFRMPDSIRYPDFPLSENSGFAQVSSGENSYYSCEDIVFSTREDASEAHRYVNRRLNQQKLAEFHARHDATNYNAPIYDEEWMSCWNIQSDMKENDRFLGAYKSTIIVPIFFGGADYMDQFRTEWDETGAGGYRTVYAYLCLDHVRARYFDEEIINFSRMFAEHIASAFFMRERWCSKSLTFSAVRLLLQSSRLGACKVS